MLTNYVTCHLFTFATVREKEKVWGRRRKQKINRIKDRSREESKGHYIWCRRRRRLIERETNLLDVWVTIDAIPLDQILMHESEYPPAIFSP